MRQAPAFPKLLIIADDLSGAADCGIACAAAGLDTVVALGETAETAPAAEVLAIDADTRRLSGAEAAAETIRFVKLHHKPGQFLFKKIDSTLRGNFAQEIGAALQVRRERGEPAIALVAPAFPATGRHTRGGRQYLDGVPVEETEVWQREGLTGRADIPEMLAASGLKAMNIPLAVIRAGAGTLASALEEASATHDAVALDAETEEDLRIIASAGVRLGDKAVWAGAAGLAKYLPLAAGWEKAASGAGLAAPVEGPVLFVVGSMSRVSHEQVEKLAAETDIHHLVVPPHVLRSGESHAQWREIAERLDLALSNGEDVVIMLGAEKKPVIGEGLELCRSLSQLVAPHATRIGALVSTGGETARAVLVAFGAAGLRLVGEVEPGVPLSVTEGGLRGSKPLPVITKAGAFGHPDTFLKCLSTLRLHGATQRIKTFSRHV